MNHAVSVDASVAVKWVVDEQLTTEARSLLADIVNADLPIVVPPHVPGEVTSAIYQKWRSTDPARHLSDDDAEEALRRFLAFPIRVITPPDLYAHAFGYARTLGIPSIYDSLYVAFARLLDVELWTADTDLLTLLAGRAPWVRPISAYPAA